MSRCERALLLVGPQHVDELRPTTAWMRRSLEYLQPLGIGIVATLLKREGIEANLQVMQPGKIGELDGEIG